MRWLFLCLACLSFSAQAAEPLARRLDAVIDRAVADQVVVGGVLLIAKNGETVYHRAFGLADREAKRPMREDAVFRLASMSKPVVTVAALALVDQGILSLDDPVTKWLPDFRPQLADGGAPAITLRQLMTHTSGLFSSLGERKNPEAAKYGVNSGLLNGTASLDEQVARIAAAPLKFAPGSEWWYGSGTDVLGAVIERASGLPLPEAVARLVTLPLHMTDTAFTTTDAARLTAAYGDGKPIPFRMADGAKVHDIAYDPSRATTPRNYPSGAAGMVGTAGDYLRLLEMLRSGGGEVLKPAMVEDMFRNQTGELPIKLMGSGWGWGLAFAVLQDPLAAKSPAPAGTVQWGGVYGTHFWIDRATGISAVLMTNTALAGTVGAFPDAIRAAVYQ